ncbi:hypothetical protein, partial [Vibrio rotiferianus]|uniref:hypothetical protein n=1 Tax=Vibrio rotiferianus TaxID=190895 RepID=UPI003918A4C0
EWPKGADCKSAGTAFDGSNPSPSTILKSQLIELAFFVLSLSFSTLPRLSQLTSSLSKNAMVRDFPLSNTLPKHSYLPQFKRASKSESIYFCQWNQAIAHLH